MDDRHIATHYSIPVGVVVGVAIGLAMLSGGHGAPAVKRSFTEWSTFKNDIRAMKAVAGTLGR